MISQTDTLFIPKNLFLFLQPSRSAMGSPGDCSGLGSGYFTLSVFLLYLTSGARNTLPPPSHILTRFLSLIILGSDFRILAGEV